jgi:uncharacterized damage-inducible protein DinB
MMPAPASLRTSADDPPCMAVAATCYLPPSIWPNQSRTTNLQSDIVNLQFFQPSFRPMDYAHVEVADREVPRARDPLFQHLLDTYASETNKTASVWRELRDDQLGFRPHQKSSTVREILTHQILSERRFFAEFVGLTEPPAAELLPVGAEPTVEAYVGRYVALARPRLTALQDRDATFWRAPVPFFDATRERIWVFWRRVLHTAHHRAQVGMCLRLLEDKVPPTYGPTADVSWKGADPTNTVAAAERRPR